MHIIEFKLDSAKRPCVPGGVAMFVRCVALWCENIATLVPDPTNPTKDVANFSECMYGLDGLDGWMTPLVHAFIVLNGGIDGGIDLSK